MNLQHSHPRTYNPYCDEFTVVSRPQLRKTEAETDIGHQQSGTEAVAPVCWRLIMHGIPLEIHNGSIIHLEE
jgi:hypothetical protein